MKSSKQCLDALAEGKIKQAWYFGFVTYLIYGRSYASKATFCLQFPTSLSKKIGIADGLCLTIDVFLITSSTIIKDHILTNGRALYRCQFPDDGYLVLDHENLKDRLDHVVEDVDQMKIIFAKSVEEYAKQHGVKLEKDVLDSLKSYFELHLDLADLTTST